MHVNWLPTTPVPHTDQRRLLWVTLAVLAATRAHLWNAPCCNNHTWCRDSSCPLTADADTGNGAVRSSGPLPVGILTVSDGKPETKERRDLVQDLQVSPREHAPSQARVWSPDCNSQVVCGTTCSTGPVAFDTDLCTTVALEHHVSRETDLKYQLDLRGMDASNISDGRAVRCCTRDL